MGRDKNDFGGKRDNANELPILLLVTLFGILMVLLFILIVFVFQTYAIWRMSVVVVAQNTEDDTEKKITQVIRASGANTNGAG